MMHGPTDIKLINPLNSTIVRRFKLPLRLTSFTYQTINISTPILASSSVCSYASVACMCLVYPTLHINTDYEHSLLESKHARYLLYLQSFYFCNFGNVLSIF